MFCLVRVYSCLTRPCILPTLDIVMGDHRQNRSPRTLREQWYPAWETASSCIRLPTDSGFDIDIDLDVISLLPRFTGVEDVYMFLREFKEVCSIVTSDPVSVDFVRLRLIPFPTL